MLFGKKKLESAQGETIPAHIAIIMDGNGRWAQARGLPRAAGHSAGSENFRRIATCLNNLGCQYLTVYAFSTENWKRSKTEIDAIMVLLERYLREAIRDMEQDSIRLRFWGDILALSKPLQRLIAETTVISDRLEAAETPGLQVNVCLNYGGRAEVTRAVRLLAEQCKRGTLNPADITESMISAHLYSAELPDPDLIIRPGREKRGSNFLIWQGSYSEFYYTDTLWPDFDEAALMAAIADYSSRARRFGAERPATE